MLTMRNYTRLCGTVSIYARPVKWMPFSKRNKAKVFLNLLFLNDNFTVAR